MKIEIKECTCDKCGMRHFARKKDKNRRQRTNELRYATQKNRDMIIEQS